MLLGENILTIPLVLKAVKSVCPILVLLNVFVQYLLLNIYTNSPSRLTSVSQNHYNTCISDFS